MIRMYGRKSMQSTRPLEQKAYGDPDTSINSGASLSSLPASGGLPSILTAASKDTTEKLRD